MQKVTLDNGSEINDIKQILDAQTNFYHDLYATRNSKLANETQKIVFDDNTPLRLTAEEADSCEGKLTLHECLG
jgi:hypothetical protein